jgi:hypothetical protein
MAPWLLTLLQLLPEIIQAILTGLKGSAPAPTAAAEEVANHAALVAKYESIQKML